MSEKISIIVPCYNEEAVLSMFMESINSVLLTMQKQYDVVFELIFIDVGSTDNTFALIRSFASKFSYVYYISFSRNFGKESAMHAGIKHAHGDFVTIIDADLQHPPELIPVMYSTLKNENYECCAPCRTRKYESRIYAFFAHSFYKLVNKISNTTIKDGAGDFRMMKRPMVDAILSLNEYNIFLKGIFGWVGFRTKWIPYENKHRVAGKTKWSFWTLFQYSLQGILAFSTVPLAFASLLGIVTCAISFIMLVMVFVKTLIWGEAITGFPTIMIVMMMLGGANLLCIGILGQYISKLYLEAKQRPKYIVAEKNVK